MQYTGTIQLWHASYSRDLVPWLILRMTVLFLWWIIPCNQRRHMRRQQTLTLNRAFFLATGKKRPLFPIPWPVHCLHWLVQHLLLKLLRVFVCFVALVMVAIPNIGNKQQVWHSSLSSPNSFSDSFKWIALGKALADNGYSLVYGTISFIIQEEHQLMFLSRWWLGGFDGCCRQSSAWKWRKSQGHRSRTSLQKWKQADMRDDHCAWYAYKEENNGWSCRMNVQQPLLWLNFNHWTHAVWCLYCPSWWLWHCRYIKKDSLLFRLIKRAIL